MLDHVRPNPTNRSAASVLRAALVVVAVLLPACSDGDAPSDGARAGRPGTWPAARFASALEPYDGCDALLDDVQARAGERVGPYGLTGMPGFGASVRFESVGAAIDVAEDSPTAGAPGADAAARVGGGDGSDSSTTNTQVAGVDEPDLVKTDGTTVYSTVDGRLSIVDLAGDTPVLLASLDLAAGTQGGGGIPTGIEQHQLLVEGDRALAIAQGWGGAGGDGPMTDGPMTDDLPGRWVPGVPSTELTLIDLSDRTAPRIVERLSVDGTLLGARLVDGRAHLVTSTGGPRLDFVYPTGNGGEPVAEATNRKVIETSVIEDWLPQARTLGPDGELRRAEPAVACEAVSHPGVDAGEGTVTVLSVDLDGGTLADHDATAVQAAGETIYASAGTLYVATREMPDPDVLDDPGQATGADLATAVHAFALDGDGPAAYLATGEVQGRLLNQFAMDEHEGVLRVATTVGAPWGPMGSGPGESTESFVTTLERRDGELVELGRVGDMGRGEQIHSVRFLGEVGYVVTFRQVDPLYTIDLSDPASPTVTGELKIPGFSSYLHPTEPGKLIGIGQDADPETGMTTGTQVSVFDVSDPANPLRTAQWTLPGGSSTAEGDHHAFLWWAAEDLLVVPVSSMQVVPTDDAQRGVPTWFEGAIGLDVTDAAITERGRILHEPRPWVEPTPPEPQPTTTTSTTTSTTALPATTSTTAPSSTTTTTEPSTTTSVVCVEPDCGPGDQGGADEAATSVAPEPGIPAPVPPGPAPAPPLPGPGAPIVRSLVVAGRLVTVSHLGIEVSRLSDLSELGWLTIAR